MRNWQRTDDRHHDLRAVHRIQQDQKATSDIIVVKFGGRAGIDPSAVCEDIAELAGADRRLVVVHGGSAEMERLAARLGVTMRLLRFPDGVVTRYTDAAALEVLILALAGAVKPALLVSLARHGVSAIGLTGLDAGLLLARRRRALRAVVDGRPVVVRDDHSGRVETVNSALLRAFLEAELVPVLSPPALADDGTPVNVNSDRVAAAVAAALGASDLVFLTGAGGVLDDPGNPASAAGIYHVPARGRALGGHITGGMGIKLMAAREALKAGVGHVRIAGAGSHPVARALAGQGGTEIKLARGLSSQSAEK